MPNVEVCQVKDYLNLGGILAKLGNFIGIVQKVFLSTSGDCWIHRFDTENNASRKALLVETIDVFQKVSIGFGAIASGWKIPTMHRVGCDA